MVVMNANVLMDMMAMAFNVMTSMSVLIQEDHQNVALVVFVSTVRVPLFVNVPSAMHLKAGIYGPFNFLITVRS